MKKITVIILPDEDVIDYESKGIPRKDERIYIERNGKQLCLLVKRVDWWAAGSVACYCEEEELDDFGNNPKEKAAKYLVRIGDGSITSEFTTLPEAVFYAVSYAFNQRRTAYIYGPKRRESIATVTVDSNTTQCIVKVYDSKEFSNESS